MSTSLLVNAGTDYVDNRAIVVTIRDGNGDLVDLTDNQVSFLVTERVSQEQLILKTTLFGITLADQTTDPGVAYIELASEDTADLTPGPFSWQLQTIDDVGTQYTEVGRFYVFTNVFTAA